MNLAVGQVWTYPETEQTPQLIVTIGRIDTAQSLGADPGNSAVVSVALSSADTDDDWPAIDHLPLSQAAFSGGELVMEDGSVPDAFQDGYTHWRAAFDAGTAGVFTLAPPQAYSAVLAAASG